MKTRLYITPGVILPDKIEMRKALDAAGRAWAEIGVSTLRVTSGMESTSTHSVASYHPYGYAVDLGARELTEDQRKQAVASIRTRLPSTYDVVDEGNHIHIEYDYARANR